MLQQQALQSKLIDGYIAQKKTGPEGPRRTSHHTQHALTNRCAHHFITFRGPPPPSVSEDVHLPGTGLASRKARATNQAEGERRVNVTESTIINAMRANSRDRDPFDPKRLMSTQNKSSKKLVPIVPTSERNKSPC